MIGTGERVGLDDDHVDFAHLDEPAGPSMRRLVDLRTAIAASLGGERFIGTQRDDAHLADRLWIALDAAAAQGREPALLVEDCWENMCARYGV